jgi:hypothetical protein
MKDSSLTVSFVSLSNSIAAATDCSILTNKQTNKQYKRFKKESKQIRQGTFDVTMCCVL